MVELQPAIAALEWVPRVLDSARDQHEFHASDGDLLDYRIRWKNEFGQFYPAGKSKVYYPVLYAVPEAPNRQALGFDLASDPSRYAALDQSIATRRTVVTAPIRLVQDSEATPSFLAFIPVFPLRSGTGQSSTEAMGLVVGVYRVRDIVSAVLEHFESAGFAVQIVDQDGGALWGKPQGLAKNNWQSHSSLQQSESVAIGSRTWTVNVHASEHFTQRQQSREPLLIALLGAATSLAIATATAARTLKLG